ncbi:MAG: D-alanine--D-alanine ligase [Bdellovibrionales bacterium]
MKVAILFGGMSAEREVSIDTSRAFESAVKELGFEYQMIDAKENVFEDLENYKPNVVLNALHGKYGEDGTIQGICEFLKIPYSGSGVLASALCMDKVKTKEILSFYNIPTPKFQTLRSKSDKIELQLPVVVKPVREGSSVGISLIKSEADLKDAIDNAFLSDTGVLVEEFCDGAELTVPVVNGKALTPIEIRPRDGFYDYKNKYTAGKTDYILPPEQSQEVIDKIKQLSEEIFKILDLRSYARVDFMLSQGEVQFLEVNTLPGCTQTSLIPKSAKHDGISFVELVSGLIKTAQLDYKST